jgi:hypothetical protein
MENNARFLNTYTKYFVVFFSFPLPVQPNSGLGRLHETFRFTSVTRSRTDGGTPWTGDQLRARPLSAQTHTRTEKRTHNTNTKHPCPEWYSNPRSRRPRERRQLMPWTARLLTSFMGTANPIRIMYNTFLLTES